MSVTFNSAVSNGWDYSQDRWIVSLLNTGSALKGHALIVVEGVDSATRFIGQYDLKSKIIVDETYSDTFQRATGNAQGYIAEIRVIETSNYTRDYQGYTARSWYAAPEDVKKMIATIKDTKAEIEEALAQDGNLPKYQSAGSERWWWLGGNRGDNCVTWAEKQLVIAHIHNDPSMLDSLKTAPQLHVNARGCALF